MATVTPSYGGATTHTITLASLASDATLIAGRQDTVIDNGSELADVAIVGGKVTTGTSPTANRQIEVWAYFTYDGTTYTAGAGASDANFSPTGEKTLMQLVTVIPTDGTSNHTYEWAAMLTFPVPPQKWGIFIVHNTGVALHATAGNHEVKHTPVKFVSA